MKQLQETLRNLTLPEWQIPNVTARIVRPTTCALGNIDVHETRGLTISADATLNYTVAVSGYTPVQTSAVIERMQQLAAPTGQPNERPLHLILANTNLLRLVYDTPELEQIAHLSDTSFSLSHLMDDREVIKRARTYVQSREALEKLLLLRGAENVLQPSALETERSPYTKDFMQAALAKGEGLHRFTFANRVIARYR